MATPNYRRATSDRTTTPAKATAGVWPEPLKLAPASLRVCSMDAQVGDRLELCGQSLPLSGAALVRPSWALTGPPCPRCSMDGGDQPSDGSSHSGAITEVLQNGGWRGKPSRPARRSRASRCSSISLLEDHAVPYRHTEPSDTALLVAPEQPAASNRQGHRT